MKRLSATLVVAALLLCSCSPGFSTTESEAVVSKFHQQFDAGSFSEVYEAAAPELKAGTSKEKFLGYMTALHDKLGTVQSSSRTSWRVYTSNKGSYIDLVYSTKYDHGVGVESFRFRTDGATPLLVGYNINSSDIISNKPGIQALLGGSAILEA